MESLLENVLGIDLRYQPVQIQWCVLILDLIRFSRHAFLCFPSWFTLEEMRIFRALRELAGDTRVAEATFSDRRTGAILLLANRMGMNDV
jgi:hypothetical protein